MRFLQILNSKDDLPDVRLSASQIQTYSRCKRKWAYERIEKRPRKQTASQTLGVKVHAHLEDYLASGKVIPSDKAGKLAQAAIANLPLPRTVEAESEFVASLETPYGLAGFIGYIDFWHNNLGKLDANQLGPILSPFARDGTGLTGDHKTSKDPDLYAKSRDELRDDPQRVLYTAVGVERALAAGEDPDRWICFWNYIATSGVRRTLPVLYEQNTRDGSLDDVFARTIVSPAFEMVRARRENTPPVEMEPNPAACNDFGGCEFRDICPLPKRERGVGPMPTLAEMIAQKNGGAVPTSAPAATTPAESEPPAVKAEVPLAERLKGLAPEKAASVTAMLERATKTVEAQAATKPAPAKGMINPPDAVDCPAEPAPVDVEAQAEAKSGEAQAEAKSGEAQAEAKPKRGPGRPPKGATSAPKHDTGNLRELVANAIDVALGERDFRSVRLLAEVMEGLDD